MSKGGDPNQIYYLLIVNQITNREIGNFLLQQNGTIEDFNLILQFKNKTISQLTQNQNITIKKSLENHIIYGKSINKKTFYFVAIKKISHPHYHYHHYSSNKDLIEALITRMEHQGISGLIDLTGELTQIGIKTLKYSMEQFITNYNKRRKRMKRIVKYFKTMMILLRLSRLIKQLIKIIEAKKDKLIQDKTNRSSSNINDNSHSYNNKEMNTVISNGELNIDRDQIRQLKKRINLLYVQFILFIVIIVVSFIIFHPIRCINHCVILK